MISAANEIKRNRDENMICNTVACDGTWKKRSYNSLNGIVTVISVNT